MKVKTFKTPSNGRYDKWSRILKDENRWIKFVILLNQIGWNEFINSIWILFSFEYLKVILDVNNLSFPV